MANNQPIYYLLLLLDDGRKLSVRDSWIELTLRRKKKGENITFFSVRQKVLLAEVDKKSWVLAELF